MGWLYRFFYVATFLIISGCVTNKQQSYPAPYNYPPQKISDQEGDRVLGVDVPLALESHTNEAQCGFIPSHYEGVKYVPSSYYCPKNSYFVSNKSNECSWVRGYSRSDGTTVDGHYRCRYTFKPYSYTSRDVSSGTYKSNRYRSSGGTTYVRGYYRKNGTYVRPHTRRR